MIGNCLKSALAVALVVASLPHAFCRCGCAGPIEPEPKAVSRCSGCCEGQEESQPSGPEPCKCVDCRQVPAVAPDSAASAVVSAPDTWSRALPNGLSVQFPLTFPSHEGASLELRLAPIGAVRALPILLGRLLF